MAKASFQLPFTGSWFVFWGGNTKELNYHHSDMAEKYALDLVVLDKQGSTHRGSGTKNEDYFSFGQPILAPADGIVIEVVDGHRDNLPQKTTNDYAYGGNYVLIKHDEGLYSALQHLKQGSVTVKAGQKVTVGLQLGECGNSGNSSEPHLHFHLMSSDILTKFDTSYNRIPFAAGLEPYFDLKLNGNRLKHYSPVKGDLISSWG